MTTRAQQERGELSRRVEGIVDSLPDGSPGLSPTSLARQLGQPEYMIPNMRRYRDRRLKETNRPIPKMRRGGLQKKVLISRPVQSYEDETQSAAPAGARDPGGPTPREAADSKPRPDVFESLAKLKLPIMPAFDVPDDAPLRARQEAAYLRALYLRQPERDARAVAAIQDVADEWLADKTIRASGLTFAREAEVAKAISSFTNLKALADFMHAFPSSTKSLDLASWLLERRDSAFVRKTATAVAIAQDVYVRDANNANPDALLDSMEAVQARLARVRGFGLAALPAPDDVIEVEAREVEADED